MRPDVIPSLKRIIARHVRRRLTKSLFKGALGVLITNCMSSQLIDHLVLVL